MEILKLRLGYVCSVWAVLQRGTVHLPAMAASAAQEDEIFLAHKEKILLPGVVGGVWGKPLVTQARSPSSSPSPRDTHLVLAPPGMF